MKGINAPFRSPIGEVIDEFIGTVREKYVEEGLRGPIALARRRIVMLQVCLVYGTAV